jgi:uncharacterized protein (TIGR02145 family)
MKKRKFWLYPFVVLGLVFTLATSCSKDDNNEIVKDIDGNIYHSVTIGTQIWMVENLKVTHYRNGDPIPNVTDSLEWGNLSTGAYCDYNNLKSNGDIYGKLYNWYAVDDSRNIAPMGWHIPSEGEWAKLEGYLGSNDIAGGKLKETGTTHWSDPNIGATNETGFTALPGGDRLWEGTYQFIGIKGSLWSATEVEPGYAWARYIYNDDTITNRDDGNMHEGFSVRCIKN